MRRVDQCSDEMKTVEKNLLRWHVRRDGMRWEELRWGEKNSHDLIWDEVSSVKCKCEVWSAGCEACTVTCEESIYFLGVALRRGCAQVICLGQQQRNRFAQSTHAQAWLAHGACKFYRWKRSYSIALRQLPPRLVRALLVNHMQSTHVKFLNFLVRVQASSPECSEPGSQKQTGREGDGWKSHDRNPVPCLSDWHDWHASAAVLATCLLYPFISFFPAAIYVLHADYECGICQPCRVEKEQRTQESLNFSYEWANSDCQQVFLPTDIRS